MRIRIRTADSYKIEFDMMVQALIFDLMDSQDNEITFKPNETHYVYWEKNPITRSDLARALRKIAYKIQRNKK